MNDLFLHRYATERVAEFRGKAERRRGQASDPKQLALRRVERSYVLLVSLYWLATVLPAAVSVLLAQSRGLSLGDIGLFMGLYSLTIVLLELPTGSLADTIGRKRTALLALGVILASKLVFLLAFSLPLFLLYALVYGLGRALMSGALEAWFVDSLLATDPRLELQPPLARAATAELLALGLGTLLSGLIPSLFPGLPAEGTALLTPFSMTVLLSALMFAVTFLAVALLVQEAPVTRQDSAPKGLGALPQVALEALRLCRRNPSLLLLLGATVAGGLALSGVETFWQPYFASLLGDRGSSLLYGLLLAGSFGLGMLGNLLATPLSRLLRGRYALAAALFQGAQGLFLVLLLLQWTVPAATALFWLVFFSRGVANSPHMALFNREVSAERRSALLSVQSLASYLGSFAGSVTLGFIAETSSIGLAWALAGALLLASVGLYLRLDARQRSARARNLSIDAGS